MKHLGDAVDELEALEQIFIKYVKVVGDAEGVDFLDESEWTPEEWAVIERLVM